MDNRFLELGVGQAVLPGAIQVPAQLLGAAAGDEAGDSLVGMPIDLLGPASSWLQDFAEHQPVTVAANALRGLMLGDGALAPGQNVAGQVGLRWRGPGRSWRSSSTSLCMPTTGTEPELSNLHKKRRQGPTREGGAAMP